MSKNQIDIAIGFGLFVLALLDFFGVDAALLRGKIHEMKIRSILLVILIIGGLSFSGYGFYRTLNPLQIITPPSVTTENIESKVREWLDAFNLGSQKVPDEKAYFNFEAYVSGSGLAPISIARMKDRPRYLTLASHISLSDSDQAFFNKFSETQKTEFLLELRLALVTAKVVAILDRSSGVLSTTVIRRLPITSDLSEATFIQQIEETSFAATIVNDTVELGLIRIGGKPTPQPSPAADKEEPKR